MSHWAVGQGCPGESQKTGYCHCSKLSSSSWRHHTCCLQDMGKQVSTGQEASSLLTGSRSTGSCYANRWEENFINNLSQARTLWATVMTRVVRYAYECNSNMNIIKVTFWLIIHFLMGFNVPSTRKKQKQKQNNPKNKNKCLLYICLRTHGAGNSQDPRVNPTVILFLRRHSIKLPSKFISPYPQINVVLRPHLRSFFVQWKTG